MKTWQRLKQDPSLFNRYFVKERVLRSIREFFWARNYHELESPVLTDALPQERYLNFLTSETGGKEVYLLPTTERFNKMMLAAGLGEHFVITKVFRGMEKLGPNHSPEFTMLEWYHLNADYFDLMDDAEKLVQKMLSDLKDLQKVEPGEQHLPAKASAQAGDFKTTYQGTEIDFGSPWHRKSVRELLREHVGVELESIIEIADIEKLCREKGVLQTEGTEYEWQDYFELLFFNFVEGNLDPAKPTFIYDYPRILGPLTKPKESDPLVVEKVELYIAGKEIANGYTELIDADEQQKRFDEERAARARMGLPVARYDHDLVAALRAGLPPVAGIGLGVDRLAMILADASSVADINYFPASEWELD
jgi:elongation factor P--beta-lysine ligase